MIELYAPQELTRLRRKRSVCLALLWAVALGGLAVCVLFCLRTGTENAGSMLRRCIAVSALCGWACIALWRTGVLPAKREAEHAEHMRSGERETLRGVASVSEETVQIRKSIAVRTVTLRSGAETRRLSILARRAKALGPTPRELTLVAVHGYVAAFSADETGTDARKKTPGNAGKRALRALKCLLSGLHNYVLWLLIAVFLWGFVFTRLTDTSPERKVTVFIDAETVEETALAAALQSAAPEQIRMVKVHIFSYAMFQTQELEEADLYVVRAATLEDYRDSFRPLPLSVSGTVWESNGTVYALRCYDAAADAGAAAGYIDYRALGEDCYLCFGARSVHAEDGAAEAVALRFLELE